jgi:phosphoribosylanthranilate isomerase
MFKIKICGITNPEDALLAAEAGADAIGLNFYEQSPRYVTPERAFEISAALRQRFASGPENRPRIIGVFVTDSQWHSAIEHHVRDQRELIAVRALQLWKTALFAGLLDGFQLHGDEPAELIFELNVVTHQHGTELGIKDPQFPIIRAFRCRESSLQQAGDYLRRCRDLGDEAKRSGNPDLARHSSLPHAVLLDAYAPGAYGGTGQVVDWNVVRNERDLLMGLPVILAGGLTPENVAEAIVTARPDAVDVASGVESSPGKKDPEKVRRFIAEARRAFGAMSRPTE